VDLGSTADRELVIDRRDLGPLPAAMRRPAGTPRSRGPGTESVAAQVELRQPTIELARPGLAAAIAGKRRELLILTEQRVALLDFLGNHRRVAVSGTAGSGKTVLADGEDGNISP